MVRLCVMGPLYNNRHWKPRTQVSGTSAGEPQIVAESTLQVKSRNRFFSTLEFRVVV